MHDIVWHSYGLEQAALTSKVLVEEFFLFELRKVLGLTFHENGVLHELVSCWPLLGRDLNHDFEHRPEIAREMVGYFGQLSL